MDDGSLSFFIALIMAKGLACLPGGRESKGVFVWYTPLYVRVRDRSQ